MAFAIADGGSLSDHKNPQEPMYRHVFDLYATAVDYDPRSGVSVKFFKIVQNKLNFTAHGHTVTEVIYECVDVEAPLMGLTQG